MAATKEKIITKYPDTLSVKKRKIAVIGLGYVGLMIAYGFSKKQDVIGFDIDADRIQALRLGYDWNGELSEKELKNNHIHYTNQQQDLKDADFYIIAVPTLLDANHHPDLTILLNASKMVGQYLKKGDIVVYESSVYPGATEEKCVPVLEASAHLSCGKDFGIGYSPERINPTDKIHTLETIPKIVAANNKKTLDVINHVYGQLVTAGTHPVSSIRVAEAIKVIENIQRDLNISFTNEIAFILHSLNMESIEIFNAMQTKWNGLSFRPGLVGGHCLPVNSYYLAHKAEEVGYHPDLIFAGRRMNEQMPKLIADLTIKQLIHQGARIKGAKIGILGLTYKEDTPNVHDTKVIDLINELKSYSVDITVHDPIADPDATKQIYGIELAKWETLNHLDAIVIAVAHQAFKQLTHTKIKSILNEKSVIIDLKGLIDPLEYKDSLISVWRL